jgi:hypothetical protein
VLASSLGSDKECLKEDRVTISLDKSTLRQCLNGVPSQAKSDVKKSWLAKEEANTIIDYANEMANKWWPWAKGGLRSMQMKSLGHIKVQTSTELTTIGQIGFS